MKSFRRMHPLTGSIQAGFAPEMRERRIICLQQAATADPRPGRADPQEDNDQDGYQAKTVTDGGARSVFHPTHLIRYFLPRQTGNDRMDTDRQYPPGRYYYHQQTGFARLMTTRVPITIVQPFSGPDRCPCRSR